MAEKRIIVKRKVFPDIGEADYFTFLTINYNDFGFLLLNLLIYLMNILSTSFQLCAIKPSTVQYYSDKICRKSSLICTILAFLPCH